ncbi:MAG: ATP-binding protein [Planctomycetota bacterium]
MPNDPDAPSTQPRPSGILAGLRIRKKLMLLHTSFSLSLAVLLLLALRPALAKIVVQGERAQAEAALTLLRAKGADIRSVEVAAGDMGRVSVAVGSPETLGLSRSQAASIGRQGSPLPLADGPDGAGVADRLGDVYVIVRSRNEAVRSAVNLVYILLIVSLLAGYAFVVAMLESVVLPRHVYGPIRAMLRADEAVRLGDVQAEQISPSLIPADELGEIMRSRNKSIARLRSNERQLEAALLRIEEVAADLRKKNHLLEAARRNLEGADRLVSLGMMSAGIAHELNTPLAVVKGLTDRIGLGEQLSDTERALLVRVVGRIESLSDGLLDFARARPPALAETDLRSVVDEAWTLVRLDRGAIGPVMRMEFVNGVPEDLEIRCDGGRMVQVFVNLVRNAIGAMRDAGTERARVAVGAKPTIREGEDWVVISVADSGPGIAPEVFERLFEPFNSTRLDAEGTGLGLAVTEGIVREHGGVLVARNATPEDIRSDPRGTGAVFEILMPVDPAGLFGTIV